MNKFLFYNKFIIFLHMFQALLCPSWGQNCIIKHLVSSHSVGDRPVHRLRENDKKTLKKSLLVLWILFADIWQDSTAVATLSTYTGEERRRKPLPTCISFHSRSLCSGCRRHAPKRTATVTWLIHSPCVLGPHVIHTESQTLHTRPTRDSHWITVPAY